MCRIASHNEAKRVGFKWQNFRCSDTCVDHLFKASCPSFLCDHLQHFCGWIVSCDSASPAVGKCKAHVTRTAAEVQNPARMQLARHGLEPLQISARGVYLARQVIRSFGPELTGAHPRSEERRV